MIKGKLLCVRGLIGVVGLTCAYMAIQLINPSDSSAIAQSNVIITILIARLVLNELLSVAHLFSIVFTIVGVMFISRPSFLFGFASPTTWNATYNSTVTLNQTIDGRQNDTNPISWSQVNVKSFSSTRSPSETLYILGIFLAILDAFSLGGCQVAIRKLCMKKVHFVISTIYACYFGNFNFFFI
jgi:drug/metabolite transporter (DMT)-like permease